MKDAAFSTTIKSIKEVILCSVRLEFNQIFFVKKIQPNCTKLETYMMILVFGQVALSRAVSGLEHNGWIQLS